MTIRKYKYYFRKPKSAIVKDVLSWLLIAGAIYVAASSPYFTVHLIRNIKKIKKYPRKKVYDTFYNLKRKGLIEVRRRNHQIYIGLTKKGKEVAGRFQINDLEIKRPKRWDEKWRLVIFDISQIKKLYREAFRGKLKELGFHPLQKSVWIHAFDCQAEIELLREFFGLSEKEIRLIVAIDIGDDSKLKEVFKLS